MWHARRRIVPAQGPTVVRHTGKGRFRVLALSRRLADGGVEHAARAMARPPRSSCNEACMKDRSRDLLTNSHCCAYWVDVA
jgi:hypothetical protein